ncbi:MAG: hypothetical protein KatS3mg043_1122 [Rhodothermaceae bacterium]|nr:MAG: hypothetical protein KatS3mg043_1122 [Rhodothermaceae bacterium]
MALTGWSERKLAYLRQRREVPFTKRGRSVLYPREGIREYLEEGASAPGGPSDERATHLPARCRPPCRRSAAGRCAAVEPMTPEDVAYLEAYDLATAYPGHLSDIIEGLADGLRAGRVVAMSAGTRTAPRPPWPPPWPTRAPGLARPALRAGRQTPAGGAGAARAARRHDGPGDAPPVVAGAPGRQRGRAAAAGRPGAGLRRAARWRRSCWASTRPCARRRASRRHGAAATSSSRSRRACTCRPAPGPCRGSTCEVWVGPTSWPRRAGPSGARTAGSSARVPVRRRPPARRRCWSAWEPPAAGPSARRPPPGARTRRSRRGGVTRRWRPTRAPCAARDWGRRPSRAPCWRSTPAPAARRSTRTRCAGSRRPWPATRPRRHRSRRLRRLSARRSRDLPRLPTSHPSAAGRPGRARLEVEREAIRWLWPGRLALGKLTILDGGGSPPPMPGQVDPAGGYCDAGRPHATTAAPAVARRSPTHRPGAAAVVSRRACEDGIADTIRPAPWPGGQRADLSARPTSSRRRTAFPGGRGA